MPLIPCPKCGYKLNPASMLGSMSKGVPRNFTKAELRRRRKRQIALNKSRAKTNNNE